MASDSDLEQRIRQRAHQIWEEQGRPAGREQEHWELAKFAIAEQDGLGSTLAPPAIPGPEPVEAILNQGEFPTLVEQGESQQVPAKPRAKRKDRAK